MPAVVVYPAQRSLRWLILVAVTASAVLLGYLATLDTGFLRLDVPSSLPGLGAALTGLTLAAVVLWHPQAGLLLLEKVDRTKLLDALGALLPASSPAYLARLRAEQVRPIQASLTQKLDDLLRSAQRHLDLASKRRLG